MSHDIKSAERPAPDPILTAIADYALNYEIGSSLAYETAGYCLMDTLACGFQALKYPACTKLLGPVVPGATLTNGARVPGTAYDLDPIHAAFNIGAMIRWLDFNDTWLAAEWGHPSDNLGAILAVADYLSRSGKPMTVREVLTAMIKAHEIQGVLALENSFNRVGLDHVLLVRVASTAVATALVWRLPRANHRRRIERLDRRRRAAHLPACAQHRFAQELGRRRCDQPRRASCAVRPQGRDGISLGAVGQDLGVSGRAVPRKSAVPAAVLGQLCDGERPLQDFLSGGVSRSNSGRGGDDFLHGQISTRIGEIERITIETQEPGVRIIDKTGPLANPADRDHCIQYMVAIPLLFGRLTASDYEDRIADDPRVDALRAKMQVKENATFTQEYYDANKRYIGNAVQVFFKDGSASPRVQVDYPIGHRKRREEGMPVLVKKFEASTAAHFSPRQTESIKALFADRDALAAMPVSDFVARLVTAS